MTTDAPRDLEIEEDLRFMRTNWRIERAGWIFMLLIVLAALAGLFGNGPLARGQAGSTADPLWIQYPRIARYRSPVELRLHAQPPFRQERLELFLSEDLLSVLRIECIMPDPLTVRAVAGGLIYTFEAPNEPALLRITAQFDSPGAVRGQIGRLGQPALECHTFVFP